MKIRRPTKAVLLAAGFGTRLLPLTREVPKPLLPLWGRTLLDRALDMLASFGVRAVLINLHHGAAAIRAHLEKNPRADMQVRFSFEPKILGTGGALVRAKAFLPDDEPFWLFNADVAADLDPEPLLADFVRHQPLATLWMVRNDGPQTVEMSAGCVRNLNSPRAGARDLFTFSGLHLLSKRILKFLPRQEAFASITAAYAMALRCGEVVRGVTLRKAFWSDLGTPRQYLAAHAAVRAAHGKQRRGGRLFDVQFMRHDNAAISPGVRIARGARLKNCVVLSGASIAADVTLRDAVVGGGTHVRQSAQGLLGRADRWLDRLEREALQRIGFEPKRTLVAALGARGSQRTFARLSSGKKTAWLMRYDPAREENKLFAQHAVFLRKTGVPVPEILLDWPRHHLCLIEDLGVADLLLAVGGLSRPKCIEHYEKVIQVVLALHTQGTPAARGSRLRRMPDFDDALYRWERDYFAEHMLQRRCGLAGAEIARIKRELAPIARRLACVPQVLVHRDLQSTNVLLKNGRPYLIDFQGMRLGPAAYDLASLLCDPYVDLPERVQQHLLASYARQNAVGVEVFWWAAVQRLAQALGAYARLSAQPEMAHFAGHIPAALRQMRRALEHLPGFPMLRRWVDKSL